MQSRLPIYFWRWRGVVHPAPTPAGVVGAKAGLSRAEIRSRRSCATACKSVETNAGWPRCRMNDATPSPEIDRKPRLHPYTVKCIPCRFLTYTQKWHVGLSSLAGLLPPISLWI